MFRRLSMFSAAAVVVTLAIGGPLAASASATDSVSGAATATAVQHPVAKHKPTLQERRRELKLRKTRARNKARARVVRIVRAQIGDRYRHGAAGPSAFDCSGLAVYVYKHAAHKALPRSSYAQYAKLRHVSKHAMKPGDLVFFFRHGVHHVGVYVGHGKIVDAENPRRGVRASRLSNSWNRRHFSGAASLF